LGRCSQGGDFSELTTLLGFSEVMKPGVTPPERVNLAELVGDKGLVVFMRHVRHRWTCPSSAL
jgi:hypothetical protein